MLSLQSIYFGQKHPSFDYKDMDIIKRVKRLAMKHHKQCENSCNGSGYVKEQCYYVGAIDNFSRSTCGQNVKSAYVKEDESIFDVEATRIEDKILNIVGAYDKKANNLEKKGPFTVEFQGDPRGATVKLYYEGDFIDLS